MLDQMVESRENYGDGKRRGGFLLTTMVLIVSLFASGLLWSLFAKDFGIGNDSLELSMLIAPVPPPAEEPPAPPERSSAPPQNTKKPDELPSRRENIIRIDESPITPPTDISVKPNTNRERPKGDFRVIPGVESDGSFSSSSTGNRGGRGGISRDSAPDGNGVRAQTLEVEDKEAPPVLKKSPTPLPPKPPIQSVGVVNGKATYLPKPQYPQVAQQMRLSGEVSVQVTIDETGKVISAKAVSGHPIFKQVAESSARNAVFNPTLLNKQPVKVTGVIVYKFSTQ